MCRAAKRQKHSHIPRRHSLQNQQAEQVRIQVESTSKSETVKAVKSVREYIESEGGISKGFQKYKEEKGNFFGVVTDENIGGAVSRVRLAYKGKGTINLTQEMIDKLNAVGFPWEGRVKKVQEDVLSV